MFDLHKRVCPCVILFTFFLFIVTWPVHALTTTTPQIEQKQSEAAQIKTQINQINDELEGIVEQYNILEIELSETEKEISQTRSRLQVAQINLDRSRAILSNRLKSIYKHGQPDFIVVLMSTRSFSDFLVRLDLLIKIGKQDARVLKEVRENKISVEKLEAKLDTQRQDQLALRNQLVEKKQEIETQLQERKIFLEGVEAEIVQLIQEEEERQRRLQEELLRQLQLQQRIRMGFQRSTTSSAADSIISIAIQFLDIPYHWAGEGPGKCPTGVHPICFDCSGYTQYVFGQIGIDLPHSAAQQYTFGVSVEKDQLMSGDLVFFGSHGVSHVGIYIGEGDFIHASSNGDIVKIQTLESHENYIGARRLI